MASGTQGPSKERKQNWAPEDWEGAGEQGAGPPEYFPCPGPPAEHGQAQGGPKWSPGERVPGPGTQQQVPCWWVSYSLQTYL